MSSLPSTSRSSWRAWPWRGSDSVTAHDGVAAMRPTSLHRYLRAAIVAGAAVAGLIVITAAARARDRTWTPARLELSARAALPPALDDSRRVREALRRLYADDADRLLW